MLNNQEKNVLLIQDLGMSFPKETSKHKVRYGMFKCFCGNNFKAQIGEVKRGNTRSCGCLIGSQNIKHNLSKHRLYPTWQQMMQRTTNPNHKFYKYYGGRGIKVCSDWLSVENFINDMYFSYGDGLKLDRTNNDLGYSKDNCRWTTQEVQARNTRKLVNTNTSGYRGVNFNQNGYIARISVGNERIYLGRFSNVIDAALAYDKYVIDNKLEHTLNFKRGE